MIDHRSTPIAPDISPHIAAAVAPAPVRDLDWAPERAEAFATEAVGLWTELLTTLRDRPIGRDEAPGDIVSALLRDVPDEPLPMDDLMDHLRRLALDHSMYPGHPGFMAYVSGAGTVPGAVADLLAAALNQNVGGWMLSPTATEIEEHVVRWLGDAIGYGDGCGGIMTSGGAAATLIALKAARDHHGDRDVRHAGVRSGPPLVCYASSEAHVVIERAADILGLGSDAVRQVPVDGERRMRLDTLEAMIARDRDDGFEPFAVVGTAGTTATGAIDPLDAIAAVCEREGLWFHVDGAYGAPTVLAPALAPLLRGIARADWVALDPHKWLYVPLAVGCLLVRRAGVLGESFGVHASYVQQDREQVERGTDLGFTGVQFSRGFAALKVWVSLLAHGRAAYARRIQHDADLARYLHARVVERPELEPMAPVSLSIACFRYVPPDIDPGRADAQEYLDQLNERVMTTIQTDGRSFCSNAVLDGRYVLRACIVNFRTEAEDVDRLLDVASELGRRVEHGVAPGSSNRLSVMEVVVGGGSVIGSVTALMLAGDGHHVTVLEGDPAPVPDRPIDAWAGWSRNGVPQFHQPHNLFPRFREVADETVPGLTERLVAAGCPWVEPLKALPPHLADGSSPADHQRMRFVTGRRPVIEAAIAGAAHDHPHVTVRRGVRIAGLRTGAEAVAGVPHVVGVTTTTGEAIDADLVIDAMGRRTQLGDWLADVGGSPPHVESETSGFVYHTRYFTGPERPVTMGPTLMALGSISILTLPGDNDTWSVTVWGSSGDRALKAARDPERWTAVVKACPLQAHWLDGTPITGVETMAGIMDRYRRYVVDGQPVVTGVVPVGDAWSCTNPSAGRGISVGALHAQRLRDALRDEPDDPVAFVHQFDELTERDVSPFVHNQFAADRRRIAEMDAVRTGADPPLDPEGAAIGAAAMTEGVVLRAVLETLFCLGLPQEVFARPAVRGAIEAHAGETPPPNPGPDRTQLLELLGSG